MNIVVLSDDAILPEFVRRPLAPLGHRVDIASSFSELRKMLDSIRPDAVLLQRRLRDSAVTEVAAWLRAQFDDYAVATIVLGLSGADRDIARDVHADGYLQIPFTDLQLLDVIGASTRTQKLILLADDSPVIHHHTVPIIKEANFEVISAYDGEQALELIKSHAPDLVISDIEMPKLDGFALCKAIKSAPETSHIPVLIASSLGETHDLERGFDAGADDYLVKPVVAEELLTRIRQLLSGTIPASRERILVVDDSPAQRHYVADCLARQGFEVSTAEDGRAGLDKARKHRPDLIISDYEMPEMTGFELVHALRSSPDTRNVPVIMLTARGTQRDMAQMRAVGATAYLVKPFAQDKCIATVERTLAEHRLLAYKQASSLYISEGARRAAEQRAAVGDLGSVRADERTMSVLFTDIVGFTSLSSKLEPAQVIELLNDYFDVLCPLILEHQGDIDKFIGDAIMAVFDDVPGHPAPPMRAVRAALAMQNALPVFNHGRTIQIHTRVGINTGPLVRGDLGSRYFRRDYTVIGDTVNRANRYETMAPADGVLVSASTFDSVRDTFVAEEIKNLRLKGVEEPVTGYLIVGAQEESEPL